MDSSIAALLAPDDPQQIGSFRIIGVLGTGGMGRVYLGVTEGGYVAVKQVLPALAAASGFVPRFQREVETLYKVPTGVGPRVLAHDSTAPRPWFATEYIPGLTVDEAVHLYGPLRGDALWSLLGEAVARLRVLHAAGIVHRDLKPANVMLTRDGLTLIDFGIARAADQTRLTRDGAVFGTHGFTPPEQDAGDQEVTAAADVYSLGALLLYAATGRSPERVPSIEPVRAVDPDLADIVESCLTRDPTARPTATRLLDAVRNRVLPADTPWPPAVMERITRREDFAATPITKIPTVPPPPVDDTAPPLPTRPWRRKLLLILPIVLVVGVGAATTVALALSESAPNTTAGPSGPSPANGMPAGGVTQSPSSQPSRGATPSPTASAVAAGKSGPTATTTAPNRRSQTTTTPAPVAYYLIQNSATGACLSDSFMVSTDASCTHSVASNGWNYYYGTNGATFELINKATGNCLAEQGSMSSFAVLASCSGSASQQWTIGYTSQYGSTLRNAESGLCLEAGSFGATMASCANPQRSQLWSKAGTV